MYVDVAVAVDVDEDVAVVGFMLVLHACCTNNLAVTATHTQPACRSTGTLAHTHTFGGNSVCELDDLHLTPNVSFVAICWLAVCVCVLYEAFAAFCGLLSGSH